ncbi:nitronate monooxygenase [Rhodococcus sp. 06-156-3C]|uniref:NAD(P)H-dependent flavin oxidoreductase n=1 Tax=Nocardiaceae TaxID=85025 RepID=UPI000522F2C1|nr:MULTISPECIES: nitronate monooxygenase family protein [Rhodococcus]OZD18255.1 nitronate monooxygenase [Rhodococcus sp. 06-156-4C]OZD18853.1 nitronate monooxygenase [Rhodococcus sp. 06-156-3C]OZD22363.1 nitronate monooxygenase [Rhodococcus sp. 06-156-4a]OZD33947.1 nitronate monooxygenase [Rhodococcus sp. 06-156-3b]OZD38684.1 nitronate monooxygenase [Rhodococcus sp. 06-156-3]
MPLPSVLSGPLRLPVVASPMFISSGPELVIAQCQAGIIGSFPALNARPSEMLTDWLDQITEANAAYAAAHPNAPVAPFAVNQIVHRTNNRLDHDMDVIVEHKVPIVITSLGARKEINEAVHSYGGIVLHDVISNEFAHKAIEKGADGIIAVAAGAGGHAGAQSPLALVQEIRRWFDGPLLLSGAIAHGRSILAAQAAGADFAYIGSAFLSTKEANAAESYKKMIVESSAKDIVYTNLFSGVHGNYLRDSIVNAGLDPDNLAESDPSTMNFGVKDTKDVKAKLWKDIWGAGQGIGSIVDTLSVAELVEVFSSQYDSAVQALINRVDPARLSVELA